METRHEPLTDRWLTAIGGATRLVFWAIGYFFGFTLVTMLSAGLLVPAPFEEVLQKQLHTTGMFYRRNQKTFLTAMATAAVGWCFLSGMSFLWYWSSR